MGLHQTYGHSTMTSQPVLELIGVQCLTIPPGQLHIVSPNASYPTENLDSLDTLSKNYARPWGSNKTLAPHFTLGQMDKVNT